MQKDQPSATPTKDSQPSSAKPSESDSQTKESSKSKVSSLFLPRKIDNFQKGKLGEPEKALSPTQVRVIKFGQILYGETLK